MTRHVFTGEYRHSVDEKGRIAVPVKFRLQLVGGGFVCRWPEDCLAIHTREGWESLAGKFEQLPLADAKARLFERYVFGYAGEVAFDRQGRFIIPSQLREVAGLGSDAVIVGARDHAEIWAPQRWDAYRRALDDPDRLAEALQGLGI